LQDIDYYSGLGEVVKLHIMGGEKRVSSILAMLPQIIAKETNALESMVYDSLCIKKSYIEGDEFDSGRRNLLNYGHCFGHALETTSNFAIPHGQAVVLGMLLANTVAKHRGLLSHKMESSIAQDLLLPTLTMKPKREYLDANATITAMKRDKKRTGEGLPLVMLNDGYSMIRVGDVSISEAEKVLHEMVTNLNSWGITNER
jgi:3-dehydroquinate synthase